MEALGGLALLFAVVWVVAGIIFFIMVLSIALDAARILRRLNKIIEMVQAGKPSPPR